MADDKVKAGALWKKEGGRGTFFTGTLDAAAAKMALDTGRTKLLVFTNGYKEDDRHPDYIVYLAEPKASK
jgi:hypothetical protein